LSAINLLISPEIMSKEIDYKNIKFSPATPIPLVFGVQAHIQRLHNWMTDPKDPLYQPEEQHANIKTLIKLYEDKKLDGFQEVWLLEGKVVTKEVAKNRPRGVRVWCEVCPEFLTSIRTHLTDTQITGITSSLCSKARLWSWAIWTSLSRSKNPAFLMWFIILISYH
jgi:hypothetical protein